MKSSRARPISVVWRQSMAGCPANSRWSSWTTCRPTASSVRMSLPRPSRRSVAVEVGERLMGQIRKPKPEGRRKPETRNPKLGACASLLHQLPHEVVLAIVDIHPQRQVAGDPMRRAAEARVVGPEGHLDFVEQALGDVAAFDEALGRLFHAH